MPEDVSSNQNNQNGIREPIERAFRSDESVTNRKRSYDKTNYVSGNKLKGNVLFNFSEKAEFPFKAENSGNSALKKWDRHVGPTKNPSCMCSNCRWYFEERILKTEITKEVKE